jgi:hypothetical protein
MYFISWKFYGPTTALVVSLTPSLTAYFAYLAPSTTISLAIIAG